MDNINYTFIIPHKNSPQLLQQCINSIPRRNDIQIIIVDDNSNIDIVDFEHFPGIHENNIEVFFTKEGKGAGYARNIGLKHARGKWLLFADADDYYNTNFIQILDKHINKTYDIIFFKVSSNIEGQYNRSLRNNKAIDQFQNGEIHLNELKFLHWQPWNKMISREFIVKHKINFDEIPIGNDAFFSLKAAEKTNNIYTINDEIYCNTFNKQSITYRKSNFQREISLLDINLRINKFLRSQNLSKHQMRIIGKIFSIFREYKTKDFIFYLEYIHKKDSLFNIIKHNLYRILHLY